MLAHVANQEILHHLEHIKEVWHQILHRDNAALQKVDQVTVRALELRAPRYSRRDALLLEGQLLSGQIFSAFSRVEREEIWRDLSSIDGLIPSLFTFFEDLKYLSACADCLKRLVKLSRRDTIYTALRRKFPPRDDADDQIVIEVAESAFIVREGATADHFDLSYGQLWLAAMRHYREMPTEAGKKWKAKLAKARVEKVDEKVLSESAARADRLGFKSNEIQVLQQRSSDKEIARNALLKARKPDRYQYDEAVLEAHITQIVRLFMTATPLPCESSSPSLVSDNPNASGKRCGFPDEDAQQQDRKFLFISYIHNESEQRGEDVTSYFVRRSVYLAFFGKPKMLGTHRNVDAQQSAPPGANQTRSSISQQSDMNGVEGSEDHRLERQETARREQERQEQERFDQEQERLEQERLEQGRLEQERRQRKQRKQARPERKREQQRRDREHRKKELEREQEKREQERLEQERLKQERLEQERLEQERLEQERLEQERLEQERLEQERLEQERLEQERLEQERLEQERLEQEILKQERREQEEREQERLEQERLEQERLEQERLEQERLEQERLEQERLEQERLEQERLEQERLEQERLEQERLEQERLEQERLEQETSKPRGDSERARKRHTHIDMGRFISGLTEIDQAGIPPKDPSQDGERAHDSRGPDLEPVNAGINVTHSEQSPTNDHSTRQEVRIGPTHLVRQTQHSTRITYYVWERGIWRISRTLDVDPSDPSEVERVAVKYMRKQIRLFDTELNILTPRDCFEAAISNGRNTILLIPESEIDIGQELEASIAELVSEKDSTAERGPKKRGRR